MSVLKRWARSVLEKRGLRLVLAVILIIVGLAPVGVPILSAGNGRQTAPTDSTRAPEPAVYRWTSSQAGATSVQRSDDGGKTWHAVGTLPQAIVQLEAVSGEEQRVFGRSASAIWWSADGGASWTQAAALPSRPLSMAVVGGQPATLFVGTESVGLLKSVNSGQTWQPVDAPELANGGVAALAISALAVNPEDGQVLYAASNVWLGTSQARLTPVGIFISVDGGTRWFEMEAVPLGAAQVSLLRPVAGRPLAVVAVDSTGSRTLELTMTPELAGRLDDPDPRTRAAVARIMALSGDRGSLAALLAHLADPDPLAGEQIATAIGRLGDKSAEPALLAALNRVTAFGAQDEAVRGRAALALGLLKSDAATSPLGQMLLSDGPLARRQAAEALARIGTPAAMAALMVPLADVDMTPARHAAMMGLELAGEPAVEPLTAALSDSRPAVRRNSAEMLGWLKPMEATPVLAKALSDPDPGVRSEAAWALGEVATPEARRALAQALKSETNMEVRAATSTALSRVEASGTANVDRLSALMGALVEISPTRWTFLGLLLVLAGALVLGKPRTPQPKHS